MSDLFTVRNMPIGNAPPKIELLGDKHVRPEPASHIIEFPGGAIELSRTTEGDYWAHIIVNRGWADGDQRGRLSAIGQVIASRVGRNLPAPAHLQEIDRQAEITQVAVLIRPDRLGRER